MNQVEVCNVALGLIGEKMITSLNLVTPSSVREELCGVMFAPALTAALEAHGWGFATDFVDLGSAQATIDPTYPVKFALPSTALRIGVVDDGSGDYAIRHIRRGRWVWAADTSTLFAEVTTYVDDPAEWTPAFALALAHKLASLIAGPITQNLVLVDNLRQRYEAELNTAARLEAGQGSPRVWKPTGTDALSNWR